ncbi:hypothetical protein BCY90_15600 [Agrobacterium deltaense]|uniref:hypothetical protein n=1 Tax=Agrobacterium TaxID=357 RepID=UPI0007459F5B|nr:MULTISPECIES: hypothetical protein [Agrobacterium]KVK54333.1 hypothetical protein L901_18350 [Agrobacterium sp. D14]RKF41745.1 hypothetical protein BCY90_15600 [Agrobacterium deltaense]
MSFFLHNRARSWFGIQDARAFARTTTPSKDATRFLMFDAFYCCLLVGLDMRRHGKGEQLEANEFIKGYPEDYRSQAELIAGLLVDAELARQDIREDDRQSIEQEMVRLLDLRSVTRLSDEGDKYLNLYAAAGFEKLEERISPPDNVEDFMVAYHSVWNLNG